MSFEVTETEKYLLDNLDEIFSVTKPRFINSLDMSGRYPCWIVWLPKEGKCERKILKDALLECAEQMIEIDKKYEKTK